MQSNSFQGLGIGLVILSAVPAMADPLPGTDAIMKSLKANLDSGTDALKKATKADVASASLLPPWTGAKWDYLHAPLAKFDASSLGNPLTSVAAAIANTMIDDGVRLNNSVVSLQYLGDHGWELVGIFNGIAYLKRPRVEPAKLPAAGEAK